MMLRHALPLDCAAPSRVESYVTKTKSQPIIVMWLVFFALVVLFCPQFSINFNYISYVTWRKNNEGENNMKFFDLVKECERVKIDCDLCECQKECAKVAQSLEDASPIMIAKLVQDNEEI